MTSSNLLMNTYEERRQILRSIVQPQKNTVEIVGMETRSGRRPEGRVNRFSREEMARSVAQALTEALECKCEGIILKSLDSIYNCGEDSRSRKAWVKIKPDYVDAAGDPLDLLILGGYYGDGRRRGNVSHFLLGVADRSGMTTDDHKFVAVCKVGSGYNDQALAQLQQQLEPHWIDFSKTIPPLSWASGYNPGAGERPHVWIQPYNSIILEVKYFCLVPSDKFNIGRTLRFPRCQQIRHDKNWHEAITRAELNKLEAEYDPSAYSAQLANAMMKDSSDSRSATHGRSGKPRQNNKRKANEVVEHFKDTDTRGVKQTTTIFRDLEFVVASAASCEQFGTKADLEIAIVQHGGTKVQNYTGNTRYIVTDNPRKGKAAVYISACQKKHSGLVQKRKAGVDSKKKAIYTTTDYGNIDVVHSSWLADCIAVQRLLPLQPRYLLHTSVETAAKLSNFYDKFGDSYNENITEDALKRIFEHVQLSTPNVGTSYEDGSKADESSSAGNSASSSTASVRDMMHEHLDDDEFEQLQFCANTFNSITVYVHAPDCNSELQMDKQIVECTCRLYGATVVETLTASVSHVILLQETKLDLERIRNEIVNLRMKDAMGGPQSRFFSNDQSVGHTGKSWIASWMQSRFVEKAIVRADWVDQCIKVAHIVDTGPYAHDLPAALDAKRGSASCLMTTVPQSFCADDELASDEDGAAARCSETSRAERPLHALGNSSDGNPLGICSAYPARETVALSMTASAGPTQQSLQREVLPTQQLWLSAAVRLSGVVSSSQAPDDTSSSSSEDEDMARMFAAEKAKALRTEYEGAAQ